MGVLRILPLDEIEAKPLVFTEVETLHIGRSTKCEIRVPIDSKDISRRHVRLIHKKEGWFAADLGKSGTFLNEERLVPSIPTLLQADDILRVGRFRFRVLKQPGRETMARYHLRVNAAKITSLDPNLVLESAMELPKQLAGAGSEAEVYTAACTYLITALHPALSAAYIVVARPDEGGTDVLARRAPEHAQRPLLSRRVVDAVCADKESVVFLHEVDPSTALEATVLPSTRAVGACFLEDAPDGAPVLIYAVGDQTIEHGEDMLASFMRLVATLTKQHVTTLRRAALTKYFSPNVVQLLMQRGGSAAAQGEPQVAEVTSMFFDLRGFSLSAEASAGDLLPLAKDLQKVMDIVADEVFRTNGTIIDYQGDGCFAAWGIPFAQDDQCFAALHCAQQVTKRLRETSFGGRMGGCGIGVAFGECLAGSVGSSSHFKYGVLGPSVNVAARLEALTKPDRLNAPILVSEEVVARVSESSLHLVRVGAFVPAGMQRTLRLFELVPRGRLLADAEAAAQWHKWLGRYEHMRTPSELNGLLQELRASSLASSPRVQWLARRCIQLQEQGALEGWTGVHHLGEK